MQRSKLNHIKLENIEIENQIARKMLFEILSNKNIQLILKKISLKILSKILNPIKKIIYDTDVLSVNDLPLVIKKSVELLALQNIRSEEPFGAVLKDFETANEITDYIFNIKNLINTLEETLIKIDQIDNSVGVLKLLKSVADLSFCYFEYYKDSHTPLFNQMKDMIWLTPEECDGRILRSELDQKSTLALTYGISTIPGVDLISAERGIGMNSGKAVFAGASLKARLAIIAKQYDDALSLSTQLENEINKTLDLNQKETLQRQWEKHNNERLKPALEKMHYYHIRLTQSGRDIKPIETTFEKLLKISDGYSLPIVANISRSTARTLISMLDIGAFENEKGEIDLDTVQIFSNCIMAFYVWGGHHSFSEVAEIYNRVLDYVVIKRPEQLSQHLSFLGREDEKYMVSKAIVERKLPYYHIGDYKTFLHNTFAKKLLPAHGDSKLERTLMSFNLT